MYSTRPYQAYSFRCGFSNNSVLAFVVRVLPQDLVSLRSFHSIVFFCSGVIVVLLFSTHHLVLSKIMFFSCLSILPECFALFAQVLFILSSLVSLFNRSADRSFSSLFLFSNGVFSTSFISVVFFLEMD